MAPTISQKKLLLVKNETNNNYIKVCEISEGVEYSRKPP